MKLCGVNAENSNKILEQKVSCKINIFKKYKFETTEHKYHINHTCPLLLLLLMSCVIVANFVDNPYLQIIIGYKNNKRKYYQIIK